MKLAVMSKVDILCKSRGLLCASFGTCQRMYGSLHPPLIAPFVGPKKEGKQKERKKERTA